MIWGLLPTLQMFGLGQTYPNRDFDLICYGTQWVERAHDQAARFMDAHIALACFACAFRYTRMLELLQRCLCIVWPLGALSATADVLLSGWYWAPEEFGCHWRRNGPLPIGDIAAISIPITSTICVASYVAILSHRRRSCSNRRVVTRTQFYILVALVTSSPYVGWSFFVGHPHLHSSRPPPQGPPHVPPQHLFALFALSRCLLKLHGTLNALVYAVQSRYWMHPASRPVTLNSNPLPSATCIDTSGFHVCFASTDSIVSFEAESSIGEHGSDANMQHRSASDASLLRALDEVYDMEDEDVAMQHGAGAEGHAAPLWRQRMERWQRIRGARQSAIAAYRENAQSASWRSCTLM